VLKFREYFLQIAIMNAAKNIIRILLDLTTNLKMYCIDINSIPHNQFSFISQEKQI